MRKEREGTPKDSTRRPVFFVAAGLVLLIAFILYMGAGALVLSSRGTVMALEQEQPEATQPEAQTEKQPAENPPASSTAPSGETGQPGSVNPPPGQDSGPLAVEMPETVVDFGGRYLEPGNTYFQTVTIRVQSKKQWAIWLSDQKNMVGEKTGTTLPPPTTEIKAISGSGAGVMLSAKNTPAGMGSMVCQGTESENEWITMTIKYRLDVSWEMEADHYVAQQTYSIMQI